MLNERAVNPQNVRQEIGAMANACKSRALTRPEFLRLPKSGNLCPYSGLSRSGMNALILPTPGNNYRPPVRSVSLRARGQLRAVRLVVYDSLMAYLHSLADKQYPTP